MGGTSEEEIAKQHSEAEALLSSIDEGECALSYLEKIDHGEIPLCWKDCPTENNPLFKKVIDDPVVSLTEEGNSKENEVSVEKRPFCISSRGIVDVSSVADIVREGFNDPPIHRAASQKKKKKKNSKTNSNSSISNTNLWDERNANKNNVHVFRPSHDAWGIKKIVLVFCDDFLKNVYEMPWWHDTSNSKSIAHRMRNAIEPILTLLSIDDSQIVRMLFAALPPGTTIPVHHDTGCWVRRTHRVHVPILVPDPSRVLFRCGPSVDQLSRIDCIPGHVFEMNNQAKHCVSNCHPTHYRVHLILDYIHPSSFNKIPHRVFLEKGEQLKQTRRSIDRPIDFGSRPTPTYFILGAQKSGTTSLYEGLVQHPWIIRARRRETHCLDWRWNPLSEGTLERRKHCQSFFYTEELFYHPSCLTGESTPSYLLDSRRCIPRMKEVFPWSCKKFFVLLRDPVKRAKSHYEMVTSTKGTEEQMKTRGEEWRGLSFEEVVMREMRVLKEDELLPHYDLEKGEVHWDVFHDFAGSEEEDKAWDLHLSKRVPLNTGSHSLLTRGMYELNLRNWIREFGRESFLVFHLEKDMKGGETNMRRTLQRAFEFLDVPNYEELKHLDERKNTRAYEDMSKDMKRMLQQFYEPYNSRLHTLLQSRTDQPTDNDTWTHPWPYPTSQ